MKIQEAIKKTGMAIICKPFRGSQGSENNVNYYAKRTNFGDYFWCDAHNDTFAFYVVDYELQYDTWIPYVKPPALTLYSKKIKIDAITIQCQCGKTIKVNLDLIKE